MKKKLYLCTLFWRGRTSNDRLSLIVEEETRVSPKSISSYLLVCSRDSLSQQKPQTMYK